MPFTGGACPSPERTGGGVGLGNKPLVQIIYESIAAARGDAYDQSWPPATAVAMENFAIARAIAFDGYGANDRLVNNFFPDSMTAIGLLPRWEAIFDAPPGPGDTEPIRRARIAAAWAKFATGNSIQPVIDAVSGVLGPIFTGVVEFTPANAVAWWPGLSGAVGEVSTTSAPFATLIGLANVLNAAYGMTITLSNASNAANNGTFFAIRGYHSTSSVDILNAAAVAPDYGVGGVFGSPTIAWTINGPTAWSSTIAHVDIQCSIPPGYGSGQSPNGLWYTAVGQARALLDEMLPAWMTFDLVLPSSDGMLDFALDEPDLDLEVLGS